MGNIHLSRRFCRDLHEVAAESALHDVPAHVLAQLESILADWADSYAKSLSQQVGKLHKDHPVFCPVGLFDSMGYGRLETAHTRTLAWLLDPNESHGFGATLLKRLLNYLCPGLVIGPVSRVSVIPERFCREHGDDGAGRADIWIEGSGWDLVIEAKVDAHESDGQLEKYNAEIKQRCGRGKAIRVFLTPDGAAARGKGWQAMSFAQLIGLFLEALPQVQGEPGYEVFRLYVAGVLKSVLGTAVGPDAKTDRGFSLLTALGAKEPAMAEFEMPEGTNRALGFYLSHWDAMEALHARRAKHRPTKKGGSDVAAVVDARAREQAARVLKTLADAVVTHLEESGLCWAKIRTQASKIGERLEIEVKLLPKYAKNRSTRWTAGFIFEPIRGKPHLVFWVWAKGGIAAERELRHVFGKRVYCGSKTFDWVEGSIALKPPIAIKVSKAFDVDTDDLLKEGRKCLQQVSKVDVRRWLEIKD